MILEIDGTYAGIKFSACHFIPGHEKCSRLHGHSYTVRFRLDGEPCENGMVMDFVSLKKKLRSYADEYDHHVLLPGRSKAVSISEINDSVEAIVLEKRYVFPKEDVIILDITNTTAENMSKMIAERLICDTDFPSNIRSVSVGLDEERGQTAWYTADL